MAWPAGLPALVSTAPLPGGWICATVRGRLADGREVVIKRSPYPAAGEAEGLQALAAARVPVPEVYGQTEHVLVLQHVTGPPDWPGLGRAVARMHRCRATQYGWHRDNYSGRFPQHNGWLDDWPTFYAERRVRIHLADPVVPPALRNRLDRACDGPLPALLPPRPPASLTHGDLWAGNVVGGRWLVDPEVSYADRELDVAYMEMTQSLPSDFWDAYLSELPTDPSYGRRRAALQLHHALLQVRHFGARSIPAVETILDSYGW